MIKVVRGNPTPEELAAALAVVQARAAAVADRPSGAPAAVRRVGGPRARGPRPAARAGAPAWGRTYWPG